MKSLVSWALLGCSQGWLTNPKPRTCLRRQENRNVLFSPGWQLLSTTPFEADYYGDDDTVNPFLEDVSPLSVRPDTKIVLGLNKYSHDTAICAADAETGKVLFATSKERLTRRKHDGGNIAVLIENCLECLDLDLGAVQHVVMNNHHHRILPLEENVRHLEWESGLGINGGSEDGYDDEENLLYSVPRKEEISHHLAHAYSTASQAPFSRGLVVVMDGMGETYRTMMAGKEDNLYTSDFDLSDKIQLIPSNLHERKSIFDWREAESVYTFEKNDNGIYIRPVFKRFQEERTPPTLYNHGFENMDSVGALYSRASSHVFGDWNACGKVMGLAPWRVHEWKLSQNDNTDRLVPPRYNHPILSGSLYSEANPLIIDRSLLEGMPLIARNDPDLFDSETMIRRRRYDFDDDEYQPPTPDGKEKEGTSSAKYTKQLPTKVALDAIGVSARIQQDLEDVAMDFVVHFQRITGERNLCLAGGVALNSVLNGRLARELGFEQTYISPYPGDDGIAVGCCAFALFGKNEKAFAPLWNKPLSPYLGPEPSEFQMKLAIEAAAPWISVETIRNDDLRIDRIVQEVEKGNVVALYGGRSELGPRALGHRSILADPRQKRMVRFINQCVKKRESFRPFAPSVLAEEAHEWFDLGETSDRNVSPYMSMTAMVKESKRGLIPAVTHVDGSARLQTVEKEAEPFYHKLISAFYRRTDVPMLLNTSFNTIPSEPIVETPQNAIRSFLCSLGTINTLVMGDYVITRNPADLGKLLGEGQDISGNLVKRPSCPKRSGRVYFDSSFSLGQEVNQEQEIFTSTRVRMPDRIMHHEEKNNWFELADELEGEILSICDGTNTLNDMMAYFTVKPNDEGYSDDEIEDTREIFEQITRRLIRLYEHTFLTW